MTSYAEFLRIKEQKNTGHGFEPTNIPDHLFGFQAEPICTCHERTTR